tara:strand:- start:1730 stop:1960 length:231 start_codon:yes stop_codon:yes gene_type:complete
MKKEVKIFLGKITKFKIMAFKMKKFSGFKNKGPVKPKSMIEAKKKPYKKPVEPGFDEPEKIAYMRRSLNPTIKNPK